ncbi:Uncharacterised protein [Mycobacteroides abscessus subsp. abscessus]|nr:Uncharacterised protein [Mycobacteroides abscessus subsp. abscessus]
MSAETISEAAARRRKSSRVPLLDSTIRSKTVESRSEWAPWSETEPTSSWSKSASTVVELDSAARNASRPA